MIVRQPFQHALRIGHDRQVAEELRLVQVGDQLLLVFDGDDLPQPFAFEISNGKVRAKIQVVAADVFGHGVGHDLIHINCDSGHKATR